MILNFQPCHVIGAQASDVIDVIDENTIVINGTAYQADPSLVTVDPCGPILGGARDAQTGIMTLTVHYQYGSADAAIWETPPYRGATPEEWTPIGNPMPETVVQLTGQTAAQVTAVQVAALCARIEGAKDAVMRAGFSYQGQMIQGDAEAQANLMAWVLINAQGALSFPRQWRRADNTFMVLNSSADLMALAGAMADFKDSVYAGIFAAKDSIRAAADLAAAQAIFDAWNTEFNS